MSYDLRFAVKTNIAGEDKYIEIGEPEYPNPTYNLSDMFRACTGWNYEQGKFYKCSDIIDKVKAGVEELTNHPSKYKKYVPINGYGTMQGAIRTLNALYDEMVSLSRWKDIPLDYVYVAW